MVIFTKKFGTLDPHLPIVWDKVPNKNPSFLGLCPKIGVAVGGWGSRVPNKYMEFCPKNFSFFQKIKCSKQPKKQNKLNFYFSLSGVPNVRGGWVGSDVWDKVPNKYVFF